MCRVLTWATSAAQQPQPAAWHACLPLRARHEKEALSCRLPAPTENCIAHRDFLSSLPPSATRACHSWAGKEAGEKERRCMEGGHQGDSAMFERTC